MNRSVEMTYRDIDWNTVWKDLYEKNAECRGSGNAPREELMRRAGRGHGGTQGDADLEGRYGALGSVRR